MQDPNPLPWGALDRFQAHFIVKANVTRDIDYLAKTILHTSGHFGAKQITAITWNGGKLADALNADNTLNEMIKKQPLHDASISVEPTSTGVRIYGKWKNKSTFTISKELYDIYNIIAGHIKSV